MRSMKCTNAEMNDAGALTAPVIGGTTDETVHVMRYVRARPNRAFVRASSR
jgi:hypothetical protein